MGKELEASKALAAEYDSLYHLAKISETTHFELGMIIQRMQKPASEAVTLLAQLDGWRKELAKALMEEPDASWEDLLACALRLQEKRRPQELEEEKETQADIELFYSLTEPAPGKVGIQTGPACNDPTEAEGRIVCWRKLIPHRGPHILDPQPLSPWITGRSAILKAWREGNYAGGVPQEAKAQLKPMSESEKRLDAALSKALGSEIEYRQDHEGYYVWVCDRSASIGHGDSREAALFDAIESLPETIRHFNRQDLREGPEEVEESELERRLSQLDDRVTEVIRGYNSRFYTLEEGKASVFDLVGVIQRLDTLEIGGKQPDVLNVKPTAPTLGPKRDPKEEPPEGINLVLIVEQYGVASIRLGFQVLCRAFPSGDWQEMDSSSDQRHRRELPWDVWVAEGDDDPMIAWYPLPIDILNAIKG